MKEFQQQLSTISSPACNLVTQIPQGAYLDAIERVVEKTSRGCSSCLNELLDFGEANRAATRSFHKFMKNKRKSAYQYDKHALGKHHLCRLLLNEFERSVSDMRLDELELYVVLVIRHKVQLSRMRRG